MPPSTASAGRPRVAASAASPHSAAARAADAPDRPAPRRASRSHTRTAIGLDPSPAICGNTNHIQCVRFRPGRELGRPPPARPAPAPPRTARGRSASPASRRAATARIAATISATALAAYDRGTSSAKPPPARVTITGTCRSSVRAATRRERRRSRSTGTSRASTAAASGDLQRQPGEGVARRRPRASALDQPLPDAEPHPARRRRRRPPAAAAGSAASRQPADLDRQPEPVERPAGRQLSHAPALRPDRRTPATPPRSRTSTPRSAQTARSRAPVRARPSTRKPSATSCPSVGEKQAEVR